MCEHSDPELERILNEFAQWLYEMMLKDQRKRSADEPPCVDTALEMPNLKGKVEPNNMKT